VLTLDKRYRPTSLDIYWLNTLLALIGDQFMEESGYVNGVWVNVRPKADKIALWTRSAKDADMQLKIGRKFKEILGLKDNAITYEEHTEQKQESTNSLKL
jgi:translation initiation factor 4E